MKYQGQKNNNKNKMKKKKNSNASAREFCVWSGQVTIPAIFRIGF